MNKILCICWMSGAVIALASCGGNGPGNQVVSVQLQTSTTELQVGDTTHIGAVPLDAAGNTVSGVVCTFASDTAAVATVDASSGLVTAISVGTANITATCSGQSASVAIDVQAADVVLTINKSGTGLGNVFVTPPGDPGFAPGSSVALTATASSGSAFTAWGGACAGSDPSGACDLVLNADTTVTATFMLAETFLSGTYNAPMNSVTDGLGCQYSVSASGTVTFTVIENNGSITGTATTTAHIDIVNTFTPANDSCTALPFDATMTGPITGSDSSFTASLATSNNNGQFAFTGARSGDTITGSATVNYQLQDGSGNPFPSSGSTGSFTATKQ